MFWILFLTLISSAWSQSLCDAVDCRTGYQCDDTTGHCVAVSCDAVGACRDEEGCAEVTCIRAPCAVQCSPCPVHSCPQPPSNAEMCTVRSQDPYVDQDGCTIVPCDVYDCPCPEVLCQHDCGPHGYLQDRETGCDTCECDCGAVCAIYCEHGNVRDQYGCATCECVPPPNTCRSNDDCDECHRCDAGHCLFTERVFERDCNTCHCDRDENTGEVGFRCTEMACPQDEPACERGASKLSPDGCNTCTCVCDDAGNCGYACTKMFCPPEEETCPQLQCRERCAYGFMPDENDCLTCDCVTPESFCSAVSCVRIECRSGQKLVRSGCCEVCEDIELSGGTCDVVSLARQTVHDDDKNTYVALKVATECVRDTLDASIEKVLRALLLDARSQVQAFVKASCCEDSTLNLVVLLQAATQMEEDEAVKNVEEALLNPKSALRSEFYAAPDSLNVVDSAFLASSTAPTSSEGLSSRDKVLIALGVLLASLLLLGAASYSRRQKMAPARLEEEEQQVEEGVVEGIAMVETSTEGLPTGLAGETTLEPQQFMNA